METLQRLSRRQVDALRVVRRSQRTDRGASLAEIARALGVRPPSALDHLTALETMGLVERRRGKSRVTRKGEACLAEYQRHHRVAETVFQRLGLPASETCSAAREIDLALSHHTVEQLCEAGGHPSECPHGAPIADCGPARGRR